MVYCTVRYTYGILFSVKKNDYERESNMDKQTFTSTLIEQCGRDEQSAERSWGFLAEKCGWNADDLARYLSGEIACQPGGAADKADASLAAFERRAGIR